MFRQSFALALASVSLGSMAFAAPQRAIAEAAAPQPERERKRRRSASKGGLNAMRRSRGPQARPKRKSNRLHLSRRTRRKHRRAA